VDVWLYDVKDTDNAKHIQFTGVPNVIPLANLKRLYAQGAKILLRLPLVPGYNDRMDNFRGVAQLAKAMPNLLGVEIMPYHRLGTSKLQRLGLPQRLDVPAADSATVCTWIDSLASLGLAVINTRPA
jgi:pyruvate formate lyase activating enzyme